MDSQRDYCEKERTNVFVLQCDKLYSAEKVAAALLGFSSLYGESVI